MIAVQETSLVRFVGEAPCSASDVLAVEAPLVIAVAHAGDERVLSTTLRTPGRGSAEARAREDEELALGFLHAEGILRAREDVVAVAADGDARVRIELARPLPDDPGRLARHVTTTSACGACGKTSLEALATPPHLPLEAPRPFLRARVVHGLSATLRAAQATFDATGGLHAAALFDAAGALVALREDVGRHNAVDKIVGHALREGALPLAGRLLLVSGRASFELVQKAVMAGVPVLAAVGAPSSLAVDLARREGLTLLGFVRDGRFNVYAGEPRVAEAQ